MIQEIKYNGFTANPSDYESADGELATAIGLVPEDGALKPVLPPKVLFYVGENEKVVFIHKTPTFTHYIIYNSSSGNLSWIADVDSDRKNIGIFNTVKSINALGNVLVLVSDVPVRYIIWKANEYIDLGSKPEKIQVETNVSISVQSSSQFEVDNGEYYDFTDYIPADVFTNAVKDPDGEVYIDDIDKTAFVNKVFSLINRMTDKSQEKGTFNAPFFIRFAYRLYDGSRMMYTSPHLVIPTSHGKPILLLRNNDDTIRPMFFLPEATLSFNFVPLDGDWKDIITHVDVFATPQIYGYIADDSGIERIAHLDDELDAYAAGNARYGGLNHVYRPKIIDIIDSGFYNLGIIPPGQTHWTGIWSKGQTYAWMDLKGEPNTNFQMYLHYQGVSGSRYFDLETIGYAEAQALGLPVNDGCKIYKVDAESLAEAGGIQAGNRNYSISISRQGRLTDNGVYFSTSKVSVDTTNCLSIKLTRNLDNGTEVKSFIDSVTGANNYHLLCSIEYDKLVRQEQTEFIISIEPELTNGAIKNLGLKESVTDDYRSGDSLLAQSVYPYNNRLSINIKAIIPFEGDSFLNIFDSPGFDSSGQGDVPEDIGIVITDIYFEIYENGVTVITHTTNDSLFNNTQFAFLTWLFYPNTSAKYAYFKGTGSIVYRVALKAHDFLNGAYAFNGFMPIADIAEQVNEVPDGLKVIPVGNKIYTSEVNNPFYFPVLGINTIGTGTILGICSAAKALSQGQFGQFPLYAFSTDGVWALEVSDTGTYSAKQPITRDVCINPDSITQIDSAVLFATDRGIMLISGSEAVCLSDSINSRDLFAISDLPKADKLVSLFNECAGEDEQITLENSSLLPFRDFLTACKMIYDYTNQRIIVYNLSVSYAYVYSLKSKLWGMIHSNIADNVNSYPDALAMLNDSALANFSLYDATGITALVVTRPFKLGNPDVLKTIDTVIQRGYFQAGHVAQILYGSRDLFNWHIVWSSTDKYLRGFRGSPYKYFRLALICQLDKAECIDGCTVQFTPRLTNKPR